MTALATYAIDEARSHPPVTDTYEYDAFGNEVSHTGTTPNNYLYRGEQWDPDLGLYYLRARYYNPVTGRFMSRDPNDGKPADPKTLHKYLYSDGDPVNAKDPTGRGALFEAALVYAFTIQRAAPAVFGATILACTSLETVDLLIEEWHLGEAAITGELPTAPSDLSVIMMEAKQYCSTIVP